MKNITLLPILLLAAACTVDEDYNYPGLGSGGCGSLPTMPAGGGESCSAGGDDDGGAEEGGVDTTAGEPDPPCQVTSMGVEYLCRGYVLGVYTDGNTEKVSFASSENRENILCVDPEPALALLTDNAFYEAENGHPNEYVDLTVCSTWHGMEDLVYYDWTDPATEEIATMLMAVCQMACEEGGVILTSRKRLKTRLEHGLLFAKSVILRGLTVGKTIHGETLPGMTRSVPINPLALATDHPPKVTSRM